MLKHILTGQPATASRQQHHHNGEFSPTVQQLGANGTAAIHQHQHQHQHQDHQLHSHHLHHHHHRNAASAGSGSGGGVRGGSADVYDSISPVISSSHRSGGGNHPTATTPSSSHHPLNHSQLSVNNLSHRLNLNSHSHGLNISTQQLSTSKHSVADSASPVVGNASSSLQLHSSHHPLDRSEYTVERPKVNGGLDISRLSRLPSQTTPSPALGSGSGHGHSSSCQVGANNPAGPSIVPLNASLASSFSQHNCTRQRQDAAGVKEMLTSLGLLCLVSLLLALLSLIFLLKISPLTVMPPPSTLVRPDEYAEEYPIVYEVTLALCALALSLNLCCLLVCAIQFLFAVKLVKSSYQGQRTNKYLQKSSISRVCAVGGFFISIPVFLTGMILYTFIQFHSTPAIVTSVFIGLGIIFCGCAIVHNVFVWQREKTNALKAMAREQCEAAAQLQRQQTQQQQQHQQHQQQQQQPQHHHQLKQQQQHQRQQHRGGNLNQSIINGAGSRGQKIGAIAQTHSSATLQSHGGSRGQSYHSHNHHHVSMSMPMSGASQQNHLHQIGSHRNVATPPTPGELSPPSPSHKHNRSLVIAREVSGSVSPGLPAATLDLSSAATTNSPHELSTLV